MNYFSIMVKKRLKPEGQVDDEEEEAEKGKNKSKKKKGSEFVSSPYPNSAQICLCRKFENEHSILFVCSQKLTEMQDWSDSSEGDADSEGEGGDDEGGNNTIPVVMSGVGGMRRKVAYEKLIHCQ